MRVRSIREVRWRQKGRFEADSGEQSVSGDDGGSICSEYGRASTRGVCLHIFVGWERRENEETGGGECVEFEEVIKWRWVNKKGE